MYVPLPVKNTFIQFDSLIEPLSLLPKATTAPAEYRPGQFLRSASRTISTQTSTNSPMATFTKNSSLFAGSFYASQNQAGKSETDSEPGLFEDPIPECDEQPLQEGQLRVTADRCQVQWLPETKRLGRHSAEHQIVSSRFELQICGEVVGFLLMIRPARTQNRRGTMRAAFKNTQHRQIQLKCLDDLESLPKNSVQVTFTVGLEQRRVTYDFQQPVCEPNGAQGLWELPVPRRGEKPVVIKVSISAAQSRW